MIRSVVIPENNKLSFNIPDNYIGKRVEVIAFMIDEGNEMAQPTKKAVSFHAIELDTRGYKFNRDEANER